LYCTLCTSTSTAHGILFWARTSPRRVVGRFMERCYVQLGEHSIIKIPQQDNGKLIVSGYHWVPGNPTMDWHIIMTCKWEKVGSFNLTSHACIWQCKLHVKGGGRFCRTVESHCACMHTLTIIQIVDDHRTRQTAGNSCCTSNHVFFYTSWLLPFTGCVVVCAFQVEIG
jgi:hypothetical protein